jgi:hypothetical protein
MSAALMKRNVNNGGGNGGVGMTAPSNGNTKSSRAMGAYAVSTATNSLRKDPAALLARGYTARYLGAVLQAYNTNSNSNKNSHLNPNVPSITTLNTEEIDRDLRHICAYQDAATRYHQLTYAAVNHITLNATKNLDALPADSTGSHMDPSSSSHYLATVALPVRIDPEEEKRRLTAQKRIQRAEAVREEFEQQYVALRAHYVLTTQELQTLSQESERTVETLQQSVSSTAALLGYHRARLQMTRDVVAAVQYRTNVLLSGECGPVTFETTPPPLPPTNGTNVDEASVAMLSQGSENNAETTTAMTSSDHQFPMLAVWTALEDECKRHLSLGPNGTKGNGTKGSKAKQAAAAASIIPWSCTMEPATSYGVPMLLSALSTVPEKSIAIQTGTMFQSTNKHSLTWMESHLPSLIDDDGEDVRKAEADAMLEGDLLHERQLNQETLIKTGQSRTQHDEWVAMISLVRQETEAVLHRHNVLLESDEVRDAIANITSLSTSVDENMLQAQDDDDDDDEDEEEDNDDDEGVDDDEQNDFDEADATAIDGVGVTSSEDVNERSATENPSNDAIDEEGASEADDEGMEEEGEDVDVDDWDATNNTNNKRASATSSSSTGNTNNIDNIDGEQGGSRNKRRKV